MDAKDKPEESTEKKDAVPATADASQKPADVKVDDPDKPDLETTSETENDSDGNSKDAPAQQTKSFKQTLKRFRVYVIAALLLATIGGVFLTVSALNGRKTPLPPSVQSQSLTQNQLKQQAAQSSNLTSGHTLTVQGNSILDGQAQVHNSLYVAGNVQSATGLSAPQLTVSGTSSFGTAQTGAIQVAAATFQGAVTFQKDVNLSGNTSLNNASFTTLTATNIIMSSDGQIEVPGHLAFIAVTQDGTAGAFPGRSVSFGVLGNGGSASVNGSDTSGTVNINTGNNPVAGCFVTLSFVAHFTHAPNILLGPIGFGAGAITRYVRLTTTVDNSGNTIFNGFRICTNDTPVPNQAFGFSYLVTN